MVRPLEIFWEHTADMDEIPVITDTGKTFCALLKELIPAFHQEDILLHFTASVINEGESQSRVTLNGRSLTALITEVAEEQRRCEGRGCEMSKPVSFPVVLFGAVPYMQVPDLVTQESVSQGNRYYLREYRSCLTRV